MSPARPQRRPMRLSLLDWGLPACIVAAYGAAGVSSLYPWQAAALDLGNTGHNLVYCAPTSGVLLHHRRHASTRIPCWHAAVACVGALDVCRCHVGITMHILWGGCCGRWEEPGGRHFAGTAASAAGAHHRKAASGEAATPWACSGSAAVPVHRCRCGSLGVDTWCQQPICMPPAIFHRIECITAARAEKCAHLDKLLHGMGWGVRGYLGSEDVQPLSQTVSLADPGSWMHASCKPKHQPCSTLDCSSCRTNTSPCAPWKRLTVQ